MILNIFLVLFIWIIGSFIFWRWGKAEYDHQSLIEASIWLGVGIGVGAFLGTLILGLTVGLIAVWRKTQISFWELADEVGVWVVLLFIPIFIINRDILHLGGYIVVAGVSFLVKKTYRRFRWYVRGKPGLAFVSFVMGLSIFDIVVAISNRTGLYFAGISGMVAGLGLLYLRVSERNKYLWSKTIKHK